MHPAYSQYYIRRIRLSAESQLVSLAEAHGYPVEYVLHFDGTIDRTTKVISFPHAFPDHTVVADNCTAIQQLEFVKRMQTDWSDNAVSVTVTYKSDELPQIKTWLRENYNQSVKSVSFLLHSGHGFVQAPIEPITRELYEAMILTCQPITSVAGICYSAEQLEGDCANGVCPIR